MKSVLIVSHGSHNPKTKKEVEWLLYQLRQKSHIPIFEYAFLEIEHPLIPEGIEKCIAQGATEVVILLNFLNSGRHVEDDIPRIVAESKAKYPKVKFEITIPVGQHKEIADLFLDLIN